MGVNQEIMECLVPMEKVMLETYSLNILKHRSLIYETEDFLPLICYHYVGQ